MLVRLTATRRRVLPSSSFVRGAKTFSRQGAPPPLGRASTDDPEARMAPGFCPPHAAFTPWLGVDVPRRSAWPLFGLDAVPPPAPGTAVLAQTLFGSGARYMGDFRSVCGPDSPPPTWSEVAVVGRSNVGKSTLLNKLFGSRDNKFVPVSRHPGKTASLDFYGVGAGARPPIVLVDTPGYGFSIRGRATTTAWMDDIGDYLQTRERGILARVALLFDSRHGLGDLDFAVLDLLESARIPCQLVATKADAVSPGELEGLALRTARELAEYSMPFPVLNAVSARSGEGIKELRIALVQTSKARRRTAVRVRV